MQNNDLKDNKVLQNGDIIKKSINRLVKYKNIKNLANFKRMIKNKLKSKKIKFINKDIEVLKDLNFLISNTLLVFPQLNLIFIPKFKIF